MLVAVGAVPAAAGLHLAGGGGLVRRGALGRDGDRQVGDGGMVAELVWLMVTV